MALRGLLLRARGEQDAAKRLLLAHIYLDQDPVPHWSYGLVLQQVSNVSTVPVDVANFRMGQRVQFAAFFQRCKAHEA